MALENSVNFFLLLCGLPAGAVIVKLRWPSLVVLVRGTNRSPCTAGRIDQNGQRYQPLLCMLKSLDLRQGLALTCKIID